jgi:hypothetical protein
MGNGSVSEDTLLVCSVDAEIRTTSHALWTVGTIWPVSLSDIVA